MTTEISKLSERAKKQLADICGDLTPEETISKLIDAEYSKHTMSLDEAADYLHMSASTLYKKIKAHLIPAHKPFGNWIFYRTELDKLLADSRQDTSREIEEKAAKILAGIR